jgi:hypothetical protein
MSGLATTQRKRARITNASGQKATNRKIKNSNSGGEGAASTCSERISPSVFIRVIRGKMDRDWGLGIISNSRLFAFIRV